MTRAEAINIASAAINNAGINKASVTSANEEGEDGPGTPMIWRVRFSYISRKYAGRGAYEIITKAGSCFVNRDGSTNIYG